MSLICGGYDLDQKGQMLTKSLALGIRSADKFARLGRTFQHGFSTLGFIAASPIHSSSVAKSIINRRYDTSMILNGFVI